MTAATLSPTAPPAQADRHLDPRLDRPLDPHLDLRFDRHSATPSPTLPLGRGGHGTHGTTTLPELLRLELAFGREDVTVFVSLASLRARFGGSDRPVGVHDLYLRHREAIDAAAERKLLAGARQPLVLRAGDL